jgi:hypothetical protein
MKTKISTTISLMLAIAMLVVIAPLGVPKAEAVKLNNTCTTKVTSGWSLMSLPSLTCVLLESESGSSNMGNFPVYLDLFIHDGDKYIHARVTENDAENRRVDEAISTAAELYVDNRIQKFSDSRFQTTRQFEQVTEYDFDQNNASRIRDYARRLARETFTSVWVYNPGSDFSITFNPGYQDEFLVASIVNILGSNSSISEINQFKNYVTAEVISDIRSELRGEPGFSTFFSTLLSGDMAIDQGWNFLTNSRLLASDNGLVNLNNGCSITKAYVFDNNSKRWINAMNGRRSSYGEGLVVYNSGSSCVATVKNSLIDWMKNILGTGTGNTPPAFPG